MSEPSTIEAELAELAAQREAVAARRQARNDQESQAAALTGAKRALADEEALEAAEREHGARRVRAVQTELGMIVVKRPHMATFRKFQDSIGGTKVDQHTAIDALVRPCVVHPPIAEFERMCAELPAIPGMVATAITVLAGFRSEDLAGK